MSCLLICHFNVLNGHLMIYLRLSCVCRYLNDVYTLEIREGTSLQWVCPNIEGPTPCPRESPAAVTVGTNRLLIYGGMNGKRLGDVWILDVGKLLPGNTLRWPCRWLDSFYTDA